MISDKVLGIVTNLTNSTKLGSLVWEEDDSKYDRRYKRKMNSVGEDGSNYELEIEYRLVNNKFVLDKSSLWIRNSKLPNGMFYIYGGTYDLNPLRDIVLSMYLQDFQPSLGDLEDTLDEISKGINVSDLRDSKLSRILNIFR